MATRPIQAFNFFRERLGLTPAQAAGFVGNLMQESTPALDPTIVGDAGASFGIAQFQGPRRRALEQFAQTRGTEPGDFQTQLEFIANEAETTERASFETIRRAQGIGDATAASVGFFRPSDPRPENRLRFARQVAQQAGLAGGGDLQVVPTSAAPQGGLLADAVPSPRNGPGLLADDPQSFLAGAAGPVGFLSSTFLSNLGAGILAANAEGRPLGSVIGQGLLQANQAVSEAQQDRIRNEAVRQQLAQAQRQRQATAELRALFNEDPTITASDPRIRSLLFEIDPGAAIETLTPREPKGLEARFKATKEELGRALTEEEIKNISGASGQPGNLAVPLSPTDLGRMRLPNGERLPLGTSLQQAISMGARVVSQSEQKRLAEADQALAVLDEVESLATGPGGIFTDVEPGLIDQGLAALTFAFEDLTRSDPKTSRFNDLRGAVVGPFIRLLGESGALAEGDVTRALGLLPSTGSLNPFNLGFADSAEQAREKLNLLRRLIEKGVSNLREGRRAEGGGGSGGVDSSGAPAADDTDFNFNPETGQLEPVR